jgi:large subunit ribosomal protein L24
MKFGSSLSPELKEKHARRSIRPRVGDTVRIVRGEYKDIEGKVTHVDTKLGVVNIEGVTHEKLKGGTAPVPIHSSNVMVTALNLVDKARKTKLEVAG